jgi:excisionase family DNA binding protein
MGTATLEANQIKSFEDLPITLSVEQVGDVLGISRTKVYELVHAKGFPTIRIGRRLIVSKHALALWIQNNGGVEI